MTNIMVDAISLKLCQKGDVMSTQKSVKINEVNYPASSVVQSLERVNKELLKLIKKYEKMVDAGIEPKEEIVFYKDMEFRGEQDIMDAYGSAMITWHRVELIRNELEQIRDYNFHLNDDIKLSVMFFKKMRNNILSDLHDLKYGD